MSREQYIADLEHEQELRDMANTQEHEKRIANARDAARCKFKYDDATVADDAQVNLIKDYFGTVGAWVTVIHWIPAEEFEDD